MSRNYGGSIVLPCMIALAACTTDPASPNGIHAPARPHYVASATSYPIGQALRLNMLWRVPRPVGSQTDYMTTAVASERDMFGSTAGSLIFYVPSDNVAGTSQLYRLFGLQVGFNDHMESTYSNEGGYATDAVLGFPWDNSLATAGLTQLVRTYKTWDHALEYDNEILDGYTGHEYMNRYGYRRYGTAATDLLSIAAGAVTVGSNRTAGCSLWSWVWNGLQFVNVHDYGRQIQTAFRIPLDATLYANPTEAGSNISTDPRPANRQGSPCLQAVNTSATDQTTRAIPLEYVPQSFGGDVTHPVIWKDVQIGKELTLNYLGLGAVAKYTSVVSTPSPLTFASVEIPSIYLNGILSSFYVYDAGTRTLSSVPRPPAAGDGTAPSSGYGGVIAANAEGSFAFGQYGVLESQGGSVSGAPGGFTMFYFPDTTEAVFGPLSNTTGKLRALRNGALPSGESRFSTYLISGTLADVRRLMDSLYIKGAK
jgi:hypothetical protein